MERTQNGTPSARKNARALLDSVHVDGIRSALKSAPVPARQLTLNEALTALLPELRDAFAKGHTATSLVDVFRVQGLHVSVRAIAQALRSKAAPPSARPKRAKAEATVTPQA